MNSYKELLNQIGGQLILITIIAAAYGIGYLIANLFNLT